jgi:hypothetical protein
VVSARAALANPVKNMSLDVQYGCAIRSGDACFSHHHDA